ncbi:uncharacterized protein LOC131658599 [Vicia villosa]|uniref:uncharacterized protein LOC131658599 n=1 Tax=Vicia villosa TaxID=3911 RepID=UPI00273BC160|nr:uncharacterized protein LOC131658599 [Vicia villosa]
MDKEVGFMNRPPVLDGSNYDYWKPRMVSFLKSIDIKVWKAVLKGWTHPVIMGEYNQPKNVLKPEVDWKQEEDKLALANSKAFNAIFNGIDKNIFRLVNTCEVAKDLWEILRTTHKGTSKVKMSRLQLLTTQFENLWMKEDESIHEFHMNVLEIANASSALGEKIPESKLVRKMLRSLPRIFDMKVIVIVIEESQDINHLKLDELVGSLQTFELSIKGRSKLENKTITFEAISDDEAKEYNSRTRIKLANAIAQLNRQVRKVMGYSRGKEP